MTRINNKFLLVILLLIFIMSTASCGSNQKMSADQGAKEDSVEQNEIGNSAEASLPNTDRKIIKNGELSIYVPDIIDTLNDVEEKVSQLDGYTSESSLNNNGDDRRNGRITIRIPTENFTQMLQWLSNTGKVQNKRIYTEDVTEEYIDLEARITNLKAQEKRLQEILTKAETVEEILKVEKEIERVRGEIDSLSGRLKYLQDRLAFSTIKLTLQESVTASSTLSTPGFNSFFQRAGVALVNNTNTLLNGTGNFLIYCIGIIPLLLPLALIALILWILRKRIFNSKKDIEK
ncbi:MAG: DUF4349 domain-containing protein [Firmicutes bacterium]|nr:DUF4349 domain-containing protein [Bacillota bacterium]